MEIFEAGQYKDSRLRIGVLSDYRSAGQLKELIGWLIRPAVDVERSGE